jgi:hypothetical protein
MRLLPVFLFGMKIKFDNYKKQKNKTKKQTNKNKKNLPKRFYNISPYNQKLPSKTRTLTLPYTQILVRAVHISPYTLKKENFQIGCFGGIN